MLKWRGCSRNGVKVILWGVQETGLQVFKKLGVKVLIFGEVFKKLGVKVLIFGEVFKGC